MTNFSVLPYELRMKIFKINTKTAFQTRITLLKKIYIPKILKPCYFDSDEFGIYERIKKYSVYLGVKRDLIHIQFVRRCEEKTYGCIPVTAEEWEKNENVWNYKVTHIICTCSKNIKV